MKKVLISAFSCLPNRGSEPGVGWNWSVLAAQAGYNVTVMTRTKSKAVIESYIPIELKDRLHFVYCNSSSKLRSITIYLEYLHWQWKSVGFARKLVKESKYDCVWFLTWGNVFLPMGMHKLGIPFIWGPLGGGEVVPRQMRKQWTLKSRIPHALKDFLCRTARFNPFVMYPAKRAWKIIARTQETKMIFPRKFHSKISVHLESVIDIEKDFDELYKPSSSRVHSGIHIVYTGRLIAFKNVETLIRAYDYCLDHKEIKDLKLIIIGDGPEKEKLEGLVALRNLLGVSFLGSLSREETIQIVSDADIFAFPSLREGASWSLLEAMLMRKPIVCFSLSGIRETTDDNCAIRVEIDPQENKDEIIDNFCKAILNACELSVDKRNAMGEAGYKRLHDVFSIEGGRETVKEWLE